MMKQLLWIGLLASATSADTALSEFEFVGEGLCAVTEECSSTSCWNSHFVRQTDSQYHSTNAETCAQDALDAGARGFTVTNSGNGCRLHPQQNPGLSNNAYCPQSGNCPAPSPYGPDWRWLTYASTFSILGGTSPILGVYPSNRSCYRRTEPAPSENPTENPTEAPTKNPTENPTEAPTDPYPALCGASGATMAGSAQSVIENIETECICAEMCSDEPGCVYWVWNIKELTCALMDETATIGASNPGSVSGELVSYPTYEPTEGVPTENPTENPTEDPTENPTEVCCKEITAECLSCLIGVTEEEFCDASPCTLGCFEKPVCCEARYCQLGLTVEKFFSSPLTPECTPVPTENPSEVPTVNPAEVPTENPTEIPTESPSEVVDPCLEYIHKGACRNQSNCIWSKRDKTCTEG